MTMNTKQQHYLTIASINVRGLNSNTKSREVLNIIRDKKFDIICLQETHLTNNSQSFLELSWNNPLHFNHHTSHSAGIAILIANTTSISDIQFSIVVPGRCSQLSFSWDNNNYILYNIYAPTTSSNQQQTFFHTIFQTISPIQEHNVILCGDWNTALQPNLDRIRATGLSPTDADPGAKHILSFMQDNNLCDIWRLRNPNER